MKNQLYRCFSIISLLSAITIVKDKRTICSTVVKSEFKTGLLPSGRKVTLYLLNLTPWDDGVKKRFSSSNSYSRDYRLLPQ